MALERELYNENNGMVTSQSVFNQSPKTSAWLNNVRLRKNGTVQKVDGSTAILEDILTNDNIINITEYVSLNAKSEILFQVKNAWYRLDVENESFTKIQETSDTGKHNYTQFKGRLIVGSRNQPPQKYFYLKRPTEPTTSSIAGNSNSGESQRTYYVRVTVNSTNGETEASVTVAQDVANDEWLKVSAPANQNGADSWNVYVSQVQGEENLQKNALAMNTDFDEETHGLVNDTQNADYPTNNTAWEWTSLGGDPPRAHYWISHNKRLFAAGISDNDMELHFSALEDEDTWGINTADDDDPGIWEYDLYLNKGDIIRGLGSVQNTLAVFMENHIIVNSFGTGATNFSISQVLKNKGTVAHNSIITAGGDLFWLDRYGIESLSQEFGIENLLFDDENPSAAINPTLAEDAQTIVENDNEHLVESEYYPLENQLVWQLPQKQSDNDVVQQRHWLFDLDEGQWSFMSGIESRSMTVDRNEKMYMGTSGEIYEVFDDSYNRAGNSYEMEYATPWLYLGDPNAKKRLQYVLMPIESSAETNFDLTVVTDMGEAITDTQSVSMPVQDVSQWNRSDWSEGLYSSTVRRLIKWPVNATAKAFKLVFEHSDTTSFEIPFFQVLYRPGGDR